MSRLTFLCLLKLSFRWSCTVSLIRCSVLYFHLCCREFMFYLVNCIYLRLLYLFMSTVFIYVYWCPPRFPYMIFVSFNRNTTCATSSSGFFGGVLVALHFSFLCHYVLSYVLWCPLPFPHRNDVRFGFVSSCLCEGSCLIYVICVCLCIMLQLFVGGLMSYIRYVCLSVYNGIQHILCYVFALFFVVLCTVCCQFIWIVHFILPLRYSLRSMNCIAFGTIEFTPLFSVALVVQSLAFCVVFCRSFFVLLSFSFDYCICCPSIYIRFIYMYY